MAAQSYDDKPQTREVPLILQVVAAELVSLPEGTVKRYNAV